MDARLQRRVQRYGWDLAVQDYVRHWHGPLAGVQSELLALAALAIPILMAARVLRRAGFSRWWALRVLVPVVNLIGLWLFAYVRWPAIDRDR
jgi:uncharacterized membrane protein YhaH (DUF805 family)